MNFSSEKEVKKMLYFAYGANMSERELRWTRQVPFKNRRHAILRGYRLEFNKKSTTLGKGFANIVPNPDGIVEGVLYTLPNDTSFETLDLYEGVHLEQYQKITVEVEVKKRERTRKYEAFAYIAYEDKTEENLKPSCEYLNKLLQGRDLLSPEYVKMLENTPTFD